MKKFLICENVTELNLIKITKLYQSSKKFWLLQYLIDLSCHVVLSWTEVSYFLQSLIECKYVV